MRSTSGGKHSGGLEGGRHVLALGDQFADLFQALLDYQVADDILGGLDRVQNRDAGRVHHGEYRGEARQDDLAQDLANIRQAQLGVVEAVARRLVGCSTRNAPTAAE
jgi:hypothetical protein